MSDDSDIRVKYNEDMCTYTICGGMIGMNPQYHKGYPCVHTAILCQEGYCCNCGIYLYKSHYWTNEKTSMKNKGKTKISESVAHSRELAIVG